MLEKVFTEGTAHTGAHLGFFSGVGVITPVLSKAWQMHIKPWVFAPGAFTLGLAIIIFSILVIAFTKRSITKVMRSVGWMLIIPGILAVLFAAFGHGRVMGSIHNSISGFAVLRPGVDFLIEHSVPQAAYIGLLYIAGGVLLIWIAGRIWNASNYV